MSTSSLKTDCELTVNAARASYPGKFSTEFKLISENEKSITLSFVSQSYGPYTVREKTRLIHFYIV